MKTQAARTHRETTVNDDVITERLLRTERPTLQIAPGGLARAVLGAKWSLTHAVLAWQENPHSAKHWLNVTDRDANRRSVWIPSVFAP